MVDMLLEPASSDLTTFRFTLVIRPRYTWGPIYGSCVDLTDVTLADADTNSIQTDNANL